MLTARLIYPSTHLGGACRHFIAPKMSCGLSPLPVLTPVRRLWQISAGRGEGSCFKLALGPLVVPKHLRRSVRPKKPFGCISGANLGARLYSRGSILDFLSNFEVVRRSSEVSILLFVYLIRVQPFCSGVNSTVLAAALVAHVRGDEAAVGPYRLAAASNGVYRPLAQLIAA